ncbi:MAG: TraM recognition domain-containing protein [Planctomycetota bacterium]
MSKKRARRRSVERRRWELKDAIVQLGDAPEDVLTNGQFFEHVAIFGSSGSGKTSSSFLPMVVFPMLATGYGAVLTAAKPADGDALERVCARAGRAGDVIRISLGGKHCFDPMTYLSTHPVRLADVEDVISIPGQAMEILNGPKKPTEEYWEGGKLSLMRELATALMLARNPVSLSVMERLLLSAPKSKEEIHTKAWQEGELCRLLDEALEQDLNETERADLERCGMNWMKAWVRTPTKSRGVFEASVRQLGDALCRGKLRNLLSSGRLTFVPELLDRGAILILDLPVLSGEANRAGQAMILQGICKYLEQRTEKPREVMRPIAICIDEAQRSITKQWTKSLQVLRSSKVCMCLVTQDIQQYVDALGGSNEAETTVKALLANCGTLVVHSVSEASTQQYISRLIGEEWQYRSNFSGAFSGHGSSQMSAGGMEQEARFLDPSYFGTQLRRGGKANDYIADAIVFQNSRIWSNGKPFLKVAFKQRFF